jgi:hypothetical protein
MTVRGGADVTPHTHQQVEHEHTGEPWHAHVLATPPSEEATELDVRAVVQAIANVAKRHGVTKDPSPVPLSLMHIYGYTAATPDMDAEIATEYARLASTERTEP